ncbi:hypothetical protein MNB_SV-4-1307 [hydrothermal vent metagenome]|uniref:Uncharacterized protein n=1 Tax=hydrothermal vent metagenome TaxID=652676 RepID=A0A1W1E8Y2_9ZZZZ
MRALFLSFATFLTLNAQPVHDMTVGDWRTVTKATSENHTHVTEKEFLNLKPDHTFEITILVSLKKGEHFIKDLQVKASGIWKRHITTLVVVIQKIEVPFAKEVSRTITQQSLEALADTYQARLKGNPIRINTITFLDDKKLTIVSEKGVKTSYTKFTGPSPLQKAPNKK